MPTTIHTTSDLGLSLLKVMKGNQMFLQAAIYPFTLLGYLLFWAGLERDLQQDSMFPLH